jgi:2-oxoglutarate dehydrogenase E2 component (dihydrolipoamide succinyltransferase)
VRRLVEEHGLDPARITATGRDGRLTKGDVLAAIDSGSAKAAPAPLRPPPPTPAEKPREAPAREIGPREERVKMSRLRRMVAERLKEAQNTAAMLTTFNEIDMTAATQRATATARRSRRSTASASDSWRCSSRRASAR